MPGKLYILGAGASHNDTKNGEFPSPLARQFFTKRLVEEYWPNYEGPRIPKFKDSSLHLILKHYFNADIFSENVDVNVEEVYSFIDSAPKVFSSSVLYKQVFLSARNELLHYIVNLFTLGLSDNKNLPLYNFISNNITDKDSILTFNWDCYLETQLENNKNCKKLLLSREKSMVPYLGTSSKFNYDDLYQDRIHGQQFLKIHGSIDSAICIDSSCIHYQYPFMLHPVETGIAPMSCPACGGSTEIFIVPPHMNKSYDTRRYLTLLARIAAEKISTASEIIIIGYSFPPFDLLANIMFRIGRLEYYQSKDLSMHLEKITLVDHQVKNEEWVNKIKNLLGLDRQKTSFGHEINFEEFLNVEDYMDYKQQNRTIGSTRRRGAALR